MTPRWPLAIEDRDWSNWSAWAGPEAGALKHLRKRLKDSFGFPKTELKAQAYWTQGREMGSSRDDDAATPAAEPRASRRLPPPPRASGVRKPAKTYWRR